jgi:hypothetical protein
MKRVWITVITLAAGSAGLAQEPRSTVPPPATEMRGALEKMVAATRVPVEARVTPAAPYSADAVNESTQTLADGNRIVQKSVTRVFRDAEGRTRREEVADTGEVMSVSIVDPVAHVSYVLDPKTRTAFQGSMLIARARVYDRGVPPTEADRRATEVAAVKMRSAMPPPPPPPPAAGTPPPPPPPPGPGMKRLMAGEAQEGSREDLGAQTVEGVAATGTRTTWTIPAGAIGNLQPIKIVSEQWFSPDLQLLVLTKHSDPRTGDNTYRLQNIVRAEPDRSLFTVPSDYTVKESGIRKE